jgi:hypothetical protein
MPSKMKAGLTGGAAANGINVVQWHTGMRLVRASVVKASDTVSARSIISRLTLDNVTKCNPYTLVTS